MDVPKAQLGNSKGLFVLFLLNIWVQFVYFMLSLKVRHVCGYVDVGMCPHQVLAVTLRSFLFCDKFRMIIINYFRKMIIEYRS